MSLDSARKEDDTPCEIAPVGLPIKDIIPKVSSKEDTHVYMASQGRKVHPNIPDFTEFDLQQDSNSVSSNSNEDDIARSAYEKEKTANSSLYQPAKE